MKPIVKSNDASRQWGAKIDPENDFRHISGNLQFLIRSVPRPVFKYQHELDRMTCTAPHPSLKLTVQSLVGLRPRFEWDGKRTPICF